MTRRLLSCANLAVFALVLATNANHAPAETIEIDSVLIRLIDQVDVPARAIGALVEVQATEGTVVREGQLLAQIDDTEAQLDYNRAKFDLDIAMREADNDVAVRSAEKAYAYSKAHFDRLYRADVAQPRSVSQSELEKARLDAEQDAFEIEKARRELENARTRKNLTANQLALAERKLEIRKILAPQSGEVVEVLRQVGEWVEPGEKMFRIVSTKRLRAEGFIRASEVTRELKGLPITLVPLHDRVGSISFSGKVAFVSREIDPVNGQVRIWAEVENPSGLLHPGHQARMTIKID